MLYRDYTKLTPEETIQVKKTNASLAKNIISLKTLKGIPKIYHLHNCLFPNNMLDIDELKDKARVSNLTAKFESLVNSETVMEREILKFIKQEKAYFIIGSLLSNHDFGHHAAYLFPEFRLSTNHVVDYLLIGKNSGGYEFVFIELECINEKVVNLNGSFGTSIRKGVQQIEDWDSWLEANYSSLRTIYSTYKNVNKDLPEEFYVLDKTRIHYVVICGRRHHYKKTTYQKRRSEKLKRNIKILHYDNLIELALGLHNKENY